MIKRISYEEAKEWEGLAQEEGMMNKFSPKAYYYSKTVKNKRVAIAGFKLVKGEMYLCHSFVPKEHRGKGYYKELVDYRLDFALKYGIPKVRAFCTSSSVSEMMRRGFRMDNKEKIFKISATNENLSRRKRMGGWSTKD